MAKRSAYDCHNLSIALHGEGIYDYSQFTVYENNKVSYPLRCIKHDLVFNVTMNDHLGKKRSGCPTCGLENRKSRVSSTTIEELQSKVDTKFGINAYTLVPQKSYGVADNVQVICSIHGEFTKLIGDLIRTDRDSGGCQECSLSSRRVDRNVLIKEASVFFENKYDYSLVDVEAIKDMTEKVTIVCDEHGEFEQSFTSHFKNLVGCQRCSATLTDSEILEKIKSLNSTSNFDNCVLEHTTPRSTKGLKINNVYCVVHLLHYNTSYLSLVDTRTINTPCPCCKTEYLSEINRSTKEEFITKAKLKHGTKFTYDKVDYVSSLSNVTITCVKHGDFSQRPDSHLTNSINCPRCVVRTSKYETDIIEMLKELGLEEEKIQQSVRPSWLLGKELDIFIPSLSLAIEFNGSVFHHSSKSEYVKPYILSMYKSPSYHYDKWEKCKQNGIRLISVYDFKWLVDTERYRSLFSHCIQKDKRVYARKCSISEIDNAIAVQFYKDNHFEGFKGSLYKNSRSFGLSDTDGILTMCCTIGEHYDQSTKGFKLKLQRICTKRYTTVVGGVTKLSKALVNTFGSFVYQSTNDTGSILAGSSKSGSSRYYWVNPTTLEFHGRNKTQKSVLEKHFSAPLLEGDTENTYMERLGYLKVYDSGLTTVTI